MRTILQLILVQIIIAQNIFGQVTDFSLNQQKTIKILNSFGLKLGLQKKLIGLDTITFYQNEIQPKNIIFLDKQSNKFVYWIPTSSERIFQKDLKRELRDNLKDEPDWYDESVINLYSYGDGDLIIRNYSHFEYDIQGLDKIYFKTSHLSNENGKYISHDIFVQIDLNKDYNNDSVSNIQSGYLIILNKIGNVLIEVNITGKEFSERFIFENKELVFIRRNNYNSFCRSDMMKYKK